MRSQKPRSENNLPKISDAEWVVMKVVWQQAPLTTKEVVEKLEDKTHWKPKTIHTLLSRLVRKGALKFERKGRDYLFHPLVSAEQCEHAVTRSCLRRFLGSELAACLA